MLEVCEDAQDRALIVLGIDTMIRVGDLFDLERSEHDGQWLYVKHAKSGEAYETALSPRAQAVLKELERTDERYYFAKFRRRSIRGIGSGQSGSGSNGSARKPACGTGTPRAG